VHLREVISELGSNVYLIIALKGGYWQRVQFKNYKAWLATSSNYLDILAHQVANGEMCIKNWTI
jgi:hypothetical protein